MEDNNLLNLKAASKFIERKTIMKRLLYYNQDSVNSFLAQIENGLLVSENSASEKTDSLSSTLGIKSDVTGDLSAKVLGIGATLKGNLHVEDSDTEVATTLIRSVQEKALHDYAFEKIYDYVLRENLVNNDNPKIGDIVLICAKMFYIHIKKS